MYNKPLRFNGDIIITDPYRESMDYHTHQGFSWMGSA